MKPSWNPPDQELVTDQLAVQPLLAVAVAVGVGVGVGLVLGEALGLVLGEALGLVLGDALGDALGLVLGDALGLVLGAGPDGGCPAPPDKTTIDWAGTFTDVPEKLAEETDGLAAE